MDEKKFVTLEMFEQYHNKLMNYIVTHDGLTADGKPVCTKCGAILTGDECENCARVEN